LWLSTFQDSTIIILSVAATISLVLGVIPPDVLGDTSGHTSSEWIEGVAIWIAVIIVATVTAGNNYAKDQQFRKLNQQKKNYPVKAIRNGASSQIDSFDVVCGDIVILQMGDQIPGDGIYIDGFDLYVDQTKVTGESDAVRKDLKKDPFMYSGCQITSGNGRMVVASVGLNSEWGRTLAKLREPQDDTPLQKKLDRLAVLIGQVGTFVAVTVFIVLCAYWLGDEVTGQPWAWEKLRRLVYNFIISVTIVVVAVPEGLPLAVTISLAYSMRQMMKDANLVRKLEACETMGGATNICSDKTGTLTENRMTVVQGWIAGNHFTKVPLETPLSKAVIPPLCEGICLNSQAYITEHPGKPMEFVGNKTEGALLVLARKLGQDYVKIREANKIVQVYDFNSARKRMSTVVVNKNKSVAPYTIYTKGASEVILRRCVTQLNEAGEVVPLPASQIEELLGSIDTLAEQGLRTLTLAYKPLPEWTKEMEAPEDELTLIAIVGILDPIRPLVPEAVKACQTAGITVRMVTGDNVKTAKKIATDCGIFTDGITLEGPDFAKMSDAELDKVLPKLQVLARATPADKERLVVRLKYKGEVVAVTGDGTNDARALKKADVGLAMGIMGTEVAKEASDIIIMDDNFVSIVRSVMWGRNVYDNIRKFLQFQLTINVVALIVAFVGAITHYGTPLKAVQLLWVNIIMDTLAALALGTEKPTPDLLNKKPYGRKSNILSHIMMRNIICQALFQVAILFMIVYAGPQIWNLAENGYNFPNKATIHYTMVFNTFVLMQVLNEFNARKVNTDINVFKGLFSNWIFVSIVLVILLGQALIVEFGSEFTSTTHLDWQYWLSCCGLALIEIPLGFLIRLIRVPLEPHEKPTRKKGVDEDLAFLTNHNVKGASVSGPASV
jgi:P-type Ca2+ transporter type 2C